MNKFRAAAIYNLPVSGDAELHGLSVQRRIKELSSIVLRSLGQLALVDTAVGGLLILAAIALINPWCALGAATGSILGSFSGYWSSSFTRQEWRSGLAGFNCAVIGIMAGGGLSTGTLRVSAVLSAVVLCLVVEFAMRRLLARWALPALTMPAVIALIFTSLVLAPASTWLWVSPGPPALGATGVAVAILFVVLAMASKCLAATLQVAVLTCVAILAGRMRGIDALSNTELWAFTVALASFAVHAVFMRGSVLGGLAGPVAALIGTIVWLFWYASGLGDVAPPLLAPFVIGVWCTLLLLRRVRHSAILQPAFWRAVAAVSKSHLRGNRVVAIVTDAPSFHLSSSPSALYKASFDRLTESRRVRSAWWQTWHEFRERLENHEPRADHRALAKLQHRQILDTIITFTMDGLLRRAGATRVVELQGSPERVRCLGCRAENGWPPVNIWRTCDLHCSDCGGLIVPGPPPATRLFESTRHAIAVSLDQDGVLIIFGTLEESRVARMIFGEARARNAQIINVTGAPRSTPPHADEILVRSNTEDMLRWLIRLSLILRLAVRIIGARVTALAILESRGDGP